MSAPGEWAWLRWVRVPWQEWTLAVALIAATAAPVLLVTSADAWRAAAEDSVTARAVDDADPVATGIDVSTEVVFDPTRIAAADEQVRSGLDRVDRLDEPDLTLYTLPGLVTIGNPVRTVGPAGRLLARPDALDAIDIVEQLPDTTGGVWITDWYADRHGLGLGDGISFEAGAIADEEWNDLVQGGGTDAVFPIVGIYRPLWSADDEQPPAYWSDVPQEVLPRYIPAFAGPNFELMLTTPETLLASGLTGVARWRAPLRSIPTTYDELRAVRNQVRSFEGALVGTGALGAAMLDVATPAARRPMLTTELYALTADTEQATERLRQPLASARTVGAAVGLSAALAVGVLFVERRRSEFRLLAGDGEGWLSMGLRVAGQLLLPTVAGAVVGVAVGLLGTRWFGPAGAVGLGDVRWSLVGAVAAASLVVAAVTAGVRGSRTLVTPDREVGRAVAATLVVTLLVAAVFAWYQVRVGRDAGSASVDLVVAALPVLTVLLALVVVLAVGSRLLGAAARLVGEHLPPTAFLATRRLAAGGSGIRLAAGALGLGIGLLLFSATLRSTLDHTVDVKLSTEVGGRTAVDLTDPLPADFVAPARTTVIGTFDTVITPGGGRVRVIAVDEADYADAVTWSDAFGASLDDVLAALRTDVAGEAADRVPAIAVRGEPVPTDGAFGLGTSFPYRVVDRIGGFPGAGQRAATILVDGEQLERLTYERAGFATADEAREAGFELPTSRFRRRMISQADPDELTAALDAAGVRYRDLVTTSARENEPGLVATRWAFGFLGVLGLVAAIGALVALAMFLAARRRANALAGVMTRAMGLSATKAALVTALEITVVVALALLAGVVAAVLSVGRLVPRFDPAPDLPPDVSVTAPWALLAAGAALGLLAIGVAIWATERAAGSRPEGEVLRDSG